MAEAGLRRRAGRLTPAEALHEAVLATGCLDAPSRPGALVARLPAEVREPLARLTSDEALGLRPLLILVAGDGRW